MPKINYIVDLAMVVSFLVTSFTGLVLFFFLPSGIRRSGYQEFLGIVKQDWTFIHDWSGIILVILVALHLVLHWKWIISMTRAMFSRSKK